MPRLFNAGVINAHACIRLPRVPLHAHMSIIAMSVFLSALQAACFFRRLIYSLASCGAFVDSSIVLHLAAQR